MCVSDEQPQNWRFLIWLAWQIVARAKDRAGNCNAGFRSSLLLRLKPSLILKTDCMISLLTREFVVWYDCFISHYVCQRRKSFEIVLNNIFKPEFCNHATLVQCLSFENIIVETLEYSFWAMNRSKKINQSRIAWLTLVGIFDRPRFIPNEQFSSLQWFLYSLIKKLRFLTNSYFNHCSFLLA